MSRALVALILLAGCASSPPAADRATVSPSDAGVGDGGLARTEPPPAGAEPQGTPDAPFRAQPPPPSAPVEFHPPVPRIAKLSNGLPVWMVEYHEVPLVTVDLVLKSGADTEAPSRSGLASFVLDALDEGTRSRDSVQIARGFEDLAARYRTEADADSSEVVVTALSSTLPEVLSIFADVALRPAFRAPDVERVREQRLGQIAQILDDPAEVAEHVLRRAIYGEKHPWAYPSEGTARTIAALKSPALARWHGRYFRPNNAALVVAGDVRAESLLPLLERSFGTWRAGKVPPARPRPPASSGAPRTVIVVDRPGAPQSQIFVGELGIDSLAPDRFATRVMNLIFGGSFNSRLNASLRTEHGWSYGAFSFFEEHREAGPFIAESGVMSDHTADALAETFRQLRRMQQGEVTDAELSDAKEALLRTIPARFTSGESVAQLFARAFAHGLPPDYFATYAEHVSGVTKEEVAKAARERLHPDRAAVVVVGPLAETRKALASLGLGAVEVRDAQGEAMEAKTAR
jgi:zinc protease